MTTAPIHLYTPVFIKDIHNLGSVQLGAFEITDFERTKMVAEIKIAQDRNILRSKETQKKLNEIKQKAGDAGDEPEYESSIVLGPKDELANKRHEKQLERDMEDSMHEVDL